MIAAEIVADSFNAATGDRLTTWRLTYPRFIHSELMTHRVLSRNAASSRAIPMSKMLAAVERDPAMPVHWGSNQPGMQAGAELQGPEREEVEHRWLEGRKDAMRCASDLSLAGLHKQIANRVLEPWMHMTTLVSGTEWLGFYRLRAHPDAQPEFQALAYRMLEVYLAAEPVEVRDGGWHIPFGDQMPEGLTLDERLKVAVARCARISYTVPDQPAVDFPVERDLALTARLASSGHWSPFEHVARALPAYDAGTFTGNFRGWAQYRHDLDRAPRSAGWLWAQAELSRILAGKPAS